MTKVSRQWNLEETANNRRRLHKRNPFNILRGKRDNTLIASMKEQQDAITRTPRKQERDLEVKILILEIGNAKDRTDD